MNALITMIIPWIEIVNPIIIEKELRERMHSGKPLRLKMGFDPSAPEIHLGHTVGLKKLKEFKPEFVLFSAGFDAHENDPLAQFELKSKDFYDITKRTLEVTNKSSNSKVVSILEGGYNLNALKESTEMHLNALIENV